MSVEVSAAQSYLDEVDALEKYKRELPSTINSFITAAVAELLTSKIRNLLH